VLYEQVTSKRALRAAWHRVRKRRPVPGADSVTVEIFEAEADTYLEALQAEILGGHYAPQPLRRILLRKEGGGERPVALPSLRDRIVQDALLHALRLPIDRVLGQGAHAYRPGRSAISALEVVQEGLSGGVGWIFKGDIATFFDTLDHDLLRARLEETLDDALVVDLVMRCVTGLVLDEMSLWDNRVGTPQGLSLSPLLSNLYMVPFDREMHVAGLNLVRYADDFVVLCATREQADRAEQTARDLLAGLRLRPKEEKWSVVSVSDGFVFLGFHFDNRGRGPSRKAVTALSWRLESARDDLAKLSTTFEQPLGSECAEDQGQTSCDGEGGSGVVPQARSAIRRDFRPASRFYEMKRAETRSYGDKLFERVGKFQGGVPGWE
jgi:group II intron reverse transcriptase/maturase